MTHRSTLSVRFGVCKIKVGVDRIFVDRALRKSLSQAAKMRISLLSCINKQNNANLLRDYFWTTYKGAGQIQKKAFYHQDFLVTCNKKHLVAVVLGAFLLFTSNIAYAMESDEERQPCPLQSRVAVPFISTLKDLDVSRDHSLSSPQDDLKELEAYSKKLYEYNIKVSNILAPEKKEIRLIFNKVWRLFSFRDVSYEPIFSLFPSIPSILATLDVSGKALSLQELEHAVDLTRNNTSIVHVVENNIQQRNPWTEEGRAHCLLTALTLRNSLLKGLVTELSYNFSSGSNLEENAISQGLQNNTSVKKLNVVLNGERGSNLLKSLKTKSEIEFFKISLYGRSLNMDEVEDLTYALKNSSSLKSLQLHVYPDNFLISSIAPVLREHNSSLEELTLISTEEVKKGAEVSREAIQSFFDALSINKNLQVLKLRIPLSLKSYQDFSEMVSFNKNLKVLALPGSNINDQMMPALCEGLAENTSLTTLDLSVNNISDIAADSLLEMLRTNSTLESIHVWETKISPSKKMKIAQALHKQ